MNNYISYVYFLDTGESVLYDGFQDRILNILKLENKIKNIEDIENA